MAEVARHAPGPSLAVSQPAPAPAPPPPPPTPAARRPDSPRRGAQVTGRISGSVTHCQEASKHMQNEVHHAKEMSSSKSMLRPDSSDKHRIPKSSGGSYSKPDARVKLIPAEEITFVQHRRPNCRTVGSAGLQKRQRRRSITPPPSSRKVSVVPLPPAASHTLSLSPNRLETAENGHSLIGEHITSSATNHIASLKKPAPPSCKSSQPSSTSLNTDDFARDFGRMDITEAFSRYYGSHILHSQGQSSKWPASLPKEAARNSDSPSPKQGIAPQSSEDHLGTKAGPSSKAVYAPENGKLYGRTCNLAPRSTGPPVLQLPIEESALPIPTSVVRQQSTLVYPDRIRKPAPHLRKYVLPIPSNKVYPNSNAGPKEATINTVSPSPKRAFGPTRSSDLHLAAKDVPPYKSVCTPENGNPCTTSGNIAARTTAAHILQSSMVESAALSQAPVLGERSTELYTDATRIAAAPIQHKSILKHVFQQKPILKHVLPSPASSLSERSTELHPSSKAGLKEAVINPVSPGTQQVLATCSSADHLGTKAGPPYKSLCAPENGEFCSTNCNLGTRPIAEPVLQSPVLESSSLSPIPVLGEASTEVFPDRIRTAVPTQQAPVAKHVLPSQTSLLSERSTEVHPNSSTKLYSSNNLLNEKCDLVPLQHNRIPQTHSPQPTAPAQFSASVISDASSEFYRKGVEETGAPAILHTKLHRKHYQSEAPWKGNFHVTGELKHICDGLEAQFPFQIFLRVYEASKKMPETLNLEAVALSQLWPKKFQMKPPDGHDIGLCFMSSHQRPQRSYDHLLEKISSHIGLWINIGDTELSIFSSKLLSPDYQRKDGKLYFWGVFGKRLRKNQRHCSNHITSIKTRNLSQPEDSHESEEIGQKLNGTEAKETERSQLEKGVTVDTRGGKDRDVVKSKKIGSTIDVTGDKVIVTDNREEIAKVLDFTGGNKTVRVNECAVVLETPDSDGASSLAATAASLLTGCCTRDTVNKSTSSLADSTCNGRDVVLGTPNSNPASSCAAPAASLRNSFGRDWSKSTFSLSDSLLQPATMSSAGSDLMLDTHPGVSLNVPPGFTKAQRLTKANDVSYVDAPPSVGMDTPAGVPNNIPPGFTEAHRGLSTITPTEPETGVSTPATEKKPIIRFSLNVPRLVKKETPPGFTSPNAVKKEPESPAVDKATEKLTPSPLAYGASPVRNITLNEVRVEDDGNSEEREVPKIRRLSELYGRPRNCTQVSRSVCSNLAVKFQATEQPEKQKHNGKRGVQGPSEPSLADTAKRLKVNGRVALSKGADRQTLNSNQDQENGRG
ncbi:hypothetical protein EJB05_07555 [Eragrostis curvula]|uniref:AIPP2-like SPOC-like domain-containing protein n=1 Tax=Eragrostis curvula TaxID=38414 RepID=A0A5J9WJ95_9POAL|nr:hypothetical protein EJB05_07555 [Eragrostis curvula]